MMLLPTTLILLGSAVATVPLTHPARRSCRPGPLAPAPSPGLKRVLIIGDSISLGAMNVITHFLALNATVAHGPWSGDGGALDTKYAMNTDVVMTGAGGTHPWMKQNTSVRFGDGCLNATFLVTNTQQAVNYDVISFNYGVHDVDYGGYGEEWVPLELYTHNIRAIKKTLQATGARIVFQSSTPVEYNLTTNQRILDWNAAAKAVMAEEPVASYSDLYAAIVAVCGNPPYNAPKIPNSPNCSISDYGGVHYHAGGWEILGNTTGKSILALLSKGDGQSETATDTARGAAAIPCDAKKLFAEARAGYAQVDGHSFDPAPWSFQTATQSTPTSCPANSTCMATAYSNTKLGCCIGYGTKAVACPDHVHCCPEGWTCSAQCRLGGCSCVPPSTED